MVKNIILKTITFLFNLVIKYKAEVKSIFNEFKINGIIVGININIIRIYLVLYTPNLYADGITIAP